MIPLVPIITIFICIFSGWSSYKIYQSWKASKEKKLKYFYKFLFFLTITFSLSIFPPLIKNLYIIQGLFYLTDFLTFICAAYFLLIILDFLNLEKFQKTIFWLLIGVGAILMIVYVNFFERALIYYYQFRDLQFVGWAINLPPILRVGPMAVFSILALSIFIFTLRKSLQIRELYLKYRGFF